MLSNFCNLATTTPDNDEDVTVRISNHQSNRMDLDTKGGNDGLEGTQIICKSEVELRHKKETT